MVSSYFLSSLAFMSDGIEKIAKVFPYTYYQVVFDFQELNFVWLISLLGASLVMVLLTWLRFVRRDIRLSGEGSWRLPLIRRKKAVI